MKEPLETVTGAGHRLGEYIREQRRGSQISVRQLAALAGVSNPYLSQIERGLRKPSAEILQQIAKGLRISAEALYLQAGILEHREGAGAVVDAVLADVALTERQKQVLLEIYDSFRREDVAEQSPPAPFAQAPAAPFAATPSADAPAPAPFAAAPAPFAVPPTGDAVSAADGAPAPVERPAPRRRAPRTGQTRTAGPSTGQPSTGQPSTRQPRTGQPRTGQGRTAPAPATSGERSGATPTSDTPTPPQEASA